MSSYHSPVSAAANFLVTILINVVASLIAGWITVWLRNRARLVPRRSNVSVEREKRPTSGVLEPSTGGSALGSGSASELGWFEPLLPFGPIKWTVNKAGSVHERRRAQLRQWSWVVTTHFLSLGLLQGTFAAVLILRFTFDSAVSSSSVMLVASLFSSERPGFEEVYNVSWIVMIPYYLGVLIVARPLITLMSRAVGFFVDLEERDNAAMVAMIGRTVLLILAVAHSGTSAAYLSGWTTPMMALKITLVLVVSSLLLALWWSARCA